MKKYNLVISILSLFGVVAGYGIIYPEGIGLCKVEDIGCIQSFHVSFPPFTLGHPLFFLSFSILIVSFILYFIPKDGFRAWSKFALWFIPFSAFLVSLAPEMHGFLSPFDKKMTSLVLSFFFFLISLIIIAVKSGNLPQKESPTPPQTPS